MTCPIDARIAAAASGEDADALAHARECLRCRALLEEQRDVIALARRTPAPVLRADHRASLAAEVMARSDVGPHRDTRVWLAGIVLAAAVFVIVLLHGVRDASAPSLPELASTDEPPIEIVERARIEHAPEDVHQAPRRAEIVSSDADFARERRDAQDIVMLRDGELAIDARDREPVTVVAGDTRVTIARSRVHIIARTGVIVTARVFAGSAEVTTAGKRQVIDAGAVWTRETPAEPGRDTAPRAPETGPSASLTAFRAGWEALRANRYLDAIAAFDRATDPVVAEDAAFWAAIASERAGNRADAATRLRAFVDRFPGSVRIEAARSALDRVSR